MTDSRISKLAQVIVDYSVAVKPGDQVFINTAPVAAPLVQELYRLLIQRGAHPLTIVQLPGLEPILYRYASNEQLKYVSPVMQHIIENFDVRIHIDSDTNTRELTGVDPARQALHAQAMRPLMKTFMERSASGALRWNVCLFPTDAYAQDAEMSTADFEDFVYNACLLDDPDPVASWQQVKAKQQALIDWLQGKQTVRLVGPDTDLRVGIAGRTWVNCCGDANMPDGEVFTGPQENSVDGTVRFSFPAIFRGREVEDVRLWFTDGAVVKWSAAKNEAYLTEMLNTDEGARRLGEFAFGANYGIRRCIKNMLFDEKIGGTVHIALGAGYPETGSVNESAIHWDMLCDLRQGGEVYVDGELFAKDGKYVLWE
ncbi:MAG: aminopeptidase [Chloroflexi bacterium HGW-Chloroflexi-1]|nr:MAG: aminopeptidase [Chloroflexi bacterium HGW-Chloroflexi-1]